MPGPCAQARANAAFTRSAVSGARRTRTPAASNSALATAPGMTRVVSNSFHMGEWQDDQTASVDDKDSCTTWCTAHLWIVPAHAEGRWKSSAGDLTLAQQFQMVSGTLRTNAGPLAITGRLRGEEISFAAGGATYTGRVGAVSIEGTVASGGNTSRWTATRTN
jgi:hypothetical protein